MLILEKVFFTTLFLLSITLHLLFDEVFICKYCVSVDLLQVGSTVLRRTVSNDRTSLPPPPLFAPPVQRRSLYTWVNPVPQDSPRSLDEYSSISRNAIQASILRDPVLTSPVVRRGPVQPTSLKIIARNTPQLVQFCEFLEFHCHDCQFCLLISFLAFFSRSMDQHCSLRGRSGIMNPSL
jgi:hypothetical protein